MQLSLQLSKLQGITSYFDGIMGRVEVKSDTVALLFLLYVHTVLKNHACNIYKYRTYNKNLEPT
jgi:hypothetical protein